MSPNFGGMNVVFHICKPRIHNLSISDPVKVSKLSGLEAYIFLQASFEGCNQLREIGLIRLE
jgi:hypothetical protein